jgi:hypothetical protein
MSICPFDGGMLVSIPSEPSVDLGLISVYSRFVQGATEEGLRGVAGAACITWGLRFFPHFYSGLFE